MAAYFEPPASDHFDPRGTVTRCIENGVRGLFLDEGTVPPAFFDLSTGLAGELLHHLQKHHMRLAGVVPDPTAHSRPFQDFVREANRGGPFRFFRTRDEAVAWLEGGGDGGR